MSNLSDEQNTAIWWYGLEGTRMGPYTELEIQELIKSNTILGDTPLWNQDKKTWGRAGSSIFRHVFKQLPLPIELLQIDNRFAWCLATIQFGLSFLLTEILGIDNPEVLRGLTLLIIGVNLFFWIKDKNILEKKGIDNPLWVWLGFTLTPVYLFFRARKTNRRYWYAIVSCVLYVLYVVVHNT